MRGWEEFWEAVVSDTGQWNGKVSKRELPKVAEGRPFFSFFGYSGVCEGL